MINTLNQENQPEVLEQGLWILYKLFLNIVYNPKDQKYRNIKTTNNTLKSKVFNIEKINQLLEIVGF